MLDARVDDTGTGFVFSEKQVDLLESETFRKYILNIVELNVTQIDITIEDYDQGVSNPNLKLGNSLNFDNLPLVNGVFKITDEQLLSNISNELLLNHIINFSFSGDAVANDLFNISISISLEGVFTD